jgi:hypothetical protein
MHASLLTTIGLLQAGSSGETGAKLFWDTWMGTLIAAVLGAAGVVVVLVSVVKGFTFVGQGKPGQAVKIAGGAILLCVFLFRPITMNNVISLVADIFDGSVSNVEQIGKCAKDAKAGADLDPNCVSATTAAPNVSVAPPSSNP